MRTPMAMNSKMRKRLPGGAPRSRIAKPLEDQRREHTCQSHHNTRCSCEEKSAHDSHTYCSRVTRIHSSI